MVERTIQHGYTEGPWDVKHMPSVSYVFSKTKLADVFSEAYGDSLNQQANARLMTAAPELLEALVRCMANCGNCDPSGTYGPTCKPCVTGRNALKKVGLSPQQIEDMLFEAGS